MFPLVSNSVLSFQLYSFPVFLTFFFCLILTAVQLQFLVPLLGCCLPKFMYSFMILKEINITESSELLFFDFLKVQMYNMIKWSKLP